MKMKIASACALLALLLTSCAAPVARPTAVPSPAETVSASPTGATFGWTVYFARDLANPVAVTVDGPPPAVTIELRVHQRMEALAAAPRSRDGGAFNVLARMTARLASVTVSGDLASLDYSVPSGNWGVDGSAMLRAFVQQVIYTASEEPGIASVLITQDGGQEAVIGGEGLVISAPQTRAGLGYEGLAPDQAARVIRMSVTTARPLLVPTGIPGDWTAAVRADANVFAVTYRDASGAKMVTLAIAMANIPLPSVESSQSAPAFHGDRSSLYQIAVAGNARSERWLVWTESGTSSLLTVGVPYFLSASGLTDMEFWRLANSLHPNQI
jgi:Sporulation and spore germination